MIKTGVAEIVELYGVEAVVIEKILNSQLSDPSENLVKIMTIAQEYFGTTKGAQSWFVTENRALGYITPLSLLINDRGFALIENSIMRLKHGFTC